MKRWLFASFIYVAFLCGVFAWHVRADLVEPYFGAGHGEVFVEVAAGASSSAIADRLMSAGVLRRKIPFLILLRWTGDSRRLQAGEYRFSGPVRPKEIAERLAKGDVYTIAMTVPEGLTAHETAAHILRHRLGDPRGLEQALRRTDWIRGLDDEATTLEGYLFPDTYRFARRTSSEAIVRTMLRQFEARAKRLLARHSLPPGRKLREWVTLASLVEKEVRIEAERGLVASVLDHRLKKRIPLACDPTIIYAMKLAGRYQGNIRKEDLAMDSPYNTYVRAGLPPGPIANPGEASLRAALAPEPSEYLYFVSRNDGTHFFSKDHRTHSAAVERYQGKGRR